MVDVIVADPAQPVLAHPVLAHPVVPGAGVPLDTPPAKPEAQKLAVTQEQVAYWLAQAGDLLPTLKKWNGVFTGLAAAMMALGGVMGWWIAPKDSTPVQAKAVQPPMPTPVAVNKPMVLTVYSLDGKFTPDAATKSILDAKGVTLIVNPNSWPATLHNLGGKKILMPAVSLSVDGTVLDAAPLSEIAAFVARIK